MRNPDLGLKTDIFIRNDNSSYSVRWIDCRLLVQGIFGRGWISDFDVMLRDERLGGRSPILFYMMMMMSSSGFFFVNARFLMVSMRSLGPWKVDITILRFKV